jgi:SAM-dependent methyltransferase
MGDTPHTLDAPELEVLPQAFHDLFAGLVRHAPGSDASTLKAARLCGLAAGARVVDLGCGPGRSALALARELGVRVAACDLHQPSLARLAREASRQHVASLVQPVVANFAHPPAASGRFQAVWCEGAVYFLGLKDALRRWDRLLAPGGRMAMTESVWLLPRDRRPNGAREFWDAEYPDMPELDGIDSLAGRAGYRVTDSFVLPESDWWSEYYGPLSRRLELFRHRARHDEDMAWILRGTQEEIRVRRLYPASFGYAFLILARRND